MCMQLDAIPLIDWTVTALAVVWYPACKSLSGSRQMFPYEEWHQ